ncbi:MAG TPA: response regulator, partial [Candidatus Sulfomarinibacteraceae bacterium]|nr:response regulator [Candidatus Sulfomarinibacteraceae bacterium]
MTDAFAGAGAREGAAGSRILIVDDEPANTTILDRLLRQAGYPQIAITNDSREALPLYEEFRPDIVLLDLHMPGVDGFEILGQIADPGGEAMRPPVVVLTADATRPARERALSLGAADFLTKPLDHLEVLLRIRHHLAKRQLELRLLFQNVDLEHVVAERTTVLQEALERLQASSEHRRRLARALASAHEDERRRIAADIHDGSVQSLVA